MVMCIRILLFITFISFALPLWAQQQGDSVSVKINPKQKKQTEKDSVVKDSARIALEKLPKTAALKSAILPGLGQLQNKRWWKVPLFYGGFAAFVLAYQDNNKQYHVFLKEVQYRLANNQTPENPAYAGYSFVGLVKIKDNFRRNRELSVIGGVVLYAVNIIDAYVDAKFFRFDISENLSLQVRPAIQNQPVLNAYRPSPALTIKLSL